MLGGSADLTGSNNTNHKGSKTVSAARAGGNYMHYGVREFGMAAIMNGIALHGGFIPYGGTFLVFSDYARNAMRMAALMQQRVMYVFTHDSIGLGEDGPTHQPIEHLASLRLIPNMTVWRPCDTVETRRRLGRGARAHRRADEPRADATGAASASRAATSRLRPSRAAATWRRIAQARPQCVLIATGSEVGLALDAAKTLRQQGRRVRVVSMPCTSVFDAQDAAYRASVLPPGDADASPSRPASATAGSATSAPTAPSSA